MGRRRFHLSSVVLVMVASVALTGTRAEAVLTSGADASIWDSTVATNVPAGIFPIGGAGQINGEFEMDTVTSVAGVTGNALQIGLRAQERFQGPTLERMGNMYFVDPGESDPGVALWNYDFHLDFGTLEADNLNADDDSLEKQLGDTLSPLNMRDFEVIFELDTNPSAAVSYVATNLNSFLTGLGLPPSNPVVLFQTSQNMAFSVFGGGNPPFDPNAAGIYDFRLTVNSTTGQVAQTHIQVKVGQLVPEPITATLGLMGLGGLGLATRRRRA